MGALALPLWVGIPIIQIIFAVFPWDVNAWFGIGFLAYYVLATPLLYEVRIYSNGYLDQKCTIKSYEHCSVQPTFTIMYSLRI